MTTDNPAIVHQVIEQQREIEALRQRVKELEEQLAACEKELADAYKAVDANWVSHQQLAASQAREQQLREALEKLSCLGNGNQPGNSIGNRIAQDALKGETK
jgi:cell division septum initiation protein DivIVA